MKMSQSINGAPSIIISFCVMVEYYSSVGLPLWLNSKESTCNEGDVVSIPGSGRSPGGGHGNPLQYCCLENSIDRGARGAAIHRVAKSQTRLKSMSTNTQYSSVYMYHLDFIFLSMDILVDSMSWLL